MSKGLVIVGNADAGTPSPASAEDAAFEYFHGRATAGAFAPRPPIHRWRASDRERFLAELQRLEDKRASDAAGAAAFAARITRQNLGAE